LGPRLPACFSPLLRGVDPFSLFRFFGIGAFLLGEDLLVSLPLPSLESNTRRSLPSLVPSFFFSLRLREIGEVVLFFCARGSLEDRALSPFFFLCNWGARRLLPRSPLSFPWSKSFLAAPFLAMLVCSFFRQRDAGQLPPPFSGYFCKSGLAARTSPFSPRFNEKQQVVHGALVFSFYQAGAVPRAPPPTLSCLPLPRWIRSWRHLIPSPFSCLRAVPAVRCPRTGISRCPFFFLGRGGGGLEHIRTLFFRVAPQLFFLSSGSSPSQEREFLSPRDPFSLGNTWDAGIALNLFSLPPDFSPPSRISSGSPFRVSLHGTNNHFLARQNNERWLFFSGEE